MKKLLYLLSFVLLSAVCLSQPIVQPNQFPNFQQFGSSSTFTRFNGASYSTYGHISAEYADTAAANVIAPVRNSPGIQIRVGDSTWIRSDDATRWINQMRGGGGISFAGIDDVLAQAQPLSAPRTIQGHAINNPLTIATNLNIGKGITLGAVATAPLITGHTTTFNLAGMDSVSVIRISANDSIWNINNIESSGSADGRILYFQNVGGYTITFRSTANDANPDGIYLELGLFDGPIVREIKVPPFSMVGFMYNAVIQKWLVFCSIAS